MRSLPLLALIGLAASGGAHAAEEKSSLRVAITIVERCDIHTGGDGTRVHCAPGVTWRVTTAPQAPPARALRGAGRSTFLAEGGRGARVTTIVF